MALGAQRGDVPRMVLFSTTFSVGSGLLAGVVLSPALNRVIAPSAQDNSIHSAVLLGVTLVGFAAMACLLPAHRASTVDPMKALRYE